MTQAIWDALYAALMREMSQEAFMAWLETQRGKSFPELDTLPPGAQPIVAAMIEVGAREHMLKVSAAGFFGSGSNETDVPEYMSPDRQGALWKETPREVERAKPPKPPKVKAPRRGFIDEFTSNMMLARQVADELKRRRRGW